MIARGYASRSELVRDLVREQLVLEAWGDERREVFGVLTIGYDHHQRGLAGRIMHLQHRQFVKILCNTHIHMDHDHCLEAIFIKGRPSEVEKLAIAIGGLRGVNYAKLTPAAPLAHGSPAQGVRGGA